MDAINMPKDSSTNSIPVLCFKPGGAQTVVPTVDGNARNSVAFNSKVISFFSTKPVKITLSDVNTLNATQTDHYIPAGMYFDISLMNGDKQYSYMSCIVPTGEVAGVVYISERV